jgi:hypothetical protein
MPTKTGRPASDRQINFLRTLVTEAQQLAAEADAETAATLAEALAPHGDSLALALSGEGIPMDTASTIIDLLVQTNRSIKQRRPVEGWSYRKLNGSFFLVGPVGEGAPEALVTASTRNGPKQAMLDRLHTVEGQTEWWTTVPPWLIEERLNAETTSELAELLAAVRARLTPTSNVVHVALPSSGTNDLAFWDLTTRAVRQTIGGTGSTPQPLATQLSVLQRLSELSDEELLEAAARYGRELGQCGLCGRDLTDEASRAAGIGPVCRTRTPF